MFKKLLSVAVAVGLLNTAAASVCPDTLRFADTGIEGTEELQLAFQQFVDEVESRLDLKVEYFPVGNRTTAVNALRFNQVDIVLAGPSEYVLMQEHVNDIKPISAIVRPQYSSIFIVPADSDINSLEDLKGKHIAMKDHGSTTGHIMPMYMLHKEGIDLDRDVRISLLGGARMQALASGEVDAVGTGVRDFEPFVKQQGEGKYQILAQSETMPGDPFVAGPHISQQCTDFIQSAFMDDPDSLLQAILAPGKRKKYEGAKMITVDDSVYDIVRESYSLL